MEKEARLQAIYDMISKSEGPVSGTALSKKFNVSRQVIVQDIALLKAKNVAYLCDAQRICMFTTKSSKSIFLFSFE